MIKTEGYSINGEEDHWTGSCPECGREFEFEGFFDPEEITKCKCGCEFTFEKVLIDNLSFIQ
jgi:hypothetical protein